MKPVLSFAVFGIVFSISFILSSCSSGYSSRDDDGVEQGIASYYAHDFHGRTTANGETYDMNTLTAAHPTLPFNTLVRVTNLDNNRSVEVRINDRGPFKGGRVIDLSLKAAKEIGLILNGTAPVTVEILELGPPTRR
ncbi:septal ring lytic transglycosylase RlpA family protein [Sphingobacteriales bacterium CHB3]|nr:septal ring lytic transglycosylase RlpA family protein [Sphingobacteriales bacterium CHB3]